MATMRRSKSGLPKYCGWNTDHHGKRRIRFRKNGFSVYLTGTPWSEDFMRQYAVALDGVTAQAANVGAARTKTLRIMLAYAVTQGMLANNPAAGIKKYRSQGEGHHSWSESEIARFEQRHPIGSKARLALSLGLYTAQRKGDVLRMGWQHVSGDSIAVRQEKTDTALKIPMHPPLVAALASVPRGNLTFLVTEHGAPFTSNGFGNWWRDRCNEAGLPHCSVEQEFHGNGWG